MEVGLSPSAGGFAKQGDEWCGLVMVWSEKFGGQKGGKEIRGGDEVSDAVICEGGIEPDVGEG